jgi:membrane protease YdiL (CAAX protease family)
LLTLPRRLHAAPVWLRISVFLTVLALAWLPLGLPLLLWVTSPNLRTILVLVWLYLLFLVWVQAWEQAVHAERAPLRRLGLWGGRSGLRWLGLGTGIGLGAVWLLFGWGAIAHWQIWQGPQDNVWSTVLEGSLTAFGIAFAEELFFRGWLLDELERSLSPRTSLLLSALLFALAHGTRPQGLALFLLGCALVWAKRLSRGNLLLPMGIHAGLIWGYYQIKVGQLFEPNPLSSAWLTGWGNNPLQSLPGLILMAALAGSLAYAHSRYRAQYRRYQPSEQRREGKSRQTNTSEQV